MSIKLAQEEIKQLRTRRNQVKASYGERDQNFDDYEDIYFMRGIPTPKGAGVDKKDWIITESPGGRDKVTGLKRILDTSEIQIKVKDPNEQSGIHANSDKIEAALKQMLKVSGECRVARPERDTNLATILYGSVVMQTNALKDLITARKSDDSDVSKFVTRQLEEIEKKTPFLIEPLNPGECYPEFGRYGLSGNLHEYTMKGSEIKEEWSADPTKFKDDTDYTVQDFFHYDKRLIEANNVTLFAEQWTTEGESLPIFIRYAGGTTLFPKPEEQLNPFLYAYGKGWYKNESLYWTHIFTRMYTQGLPGPTVLRDPDDTHDVDVDYRGGVKIITAKGQLTNIPIVDNDTIQLKGLIDQQTGKSTIQEQTIGGASEASTFSSYVMQVNAGKLPAIDPKEAQEQVYRDLFLYILKRIKNEGIENDLIKPEEIPDNPELEVTLEPNLQQDDLRNAQIVAQLKNAGVNVSDEWINSYLLKIADSFAMFRQKTKEDARKAIVARTFQNPQIMDRFIMIALGQGQQPPPTQPGPVPPETAMPAEGQVPPEGMMPAQPGQAGMEATPQTEAMLTPQERGNGQQIRSQ